MNAIKESSIVQEKIPNRFSDPTQAKDFMLKLLGAFFIDGDPTPSSSEITKIAHALNRGDELADSLVKSMPPGRLMPLLNQALEKGIESVKDAPVELKALFDQVDTIPSWVDWELYQQATIVAQRTSFFGEFILSCVSLMGGYRSSAANKPIALTGALTYNAKRRIAETSQFTYDVTRKDSMRRENVGFKSAVKVRIMHAHVRNRLSNSDEWNHDEWGLPVNQADLVSTNLLFSMVFLMGLRVMGFRFSERDSFATMQLWRYIGYVMGIEEDLLPHTEAEGQKLAYLVGNSQPPADEDSRKLGEALRDVPFESASTLPEQILAFFEMHYRSGLRRAILGGKAGDDLGLPATPFIFAPLITSPLIYLAETIRMTFPALENVMANIGETWLNYRIQSMVAGKPADFIFKGPVAPQGTLAGSAT